MQQQFDQWYSNLHARSELMNIGHQSMGYSAPTVAATAVATGGNYSSGGSGGNSMKDYTRDVLRPPQESRSPRGSMPSSSSSSGYAVPSPSSSVTFQTPPLQGSSEVAARAPAQAFPSTMIRPNPHTNANANANANLNTNPSSSSGRNSSTLPQLQQQQQQYREGRSKESGSFPTPTTPSASAAGGAGGSNGSSGDNMVNEDIALFYQAKDELLKRRAAMNR